MDMIQSTFHVEKEFNLDGYTGIIGIDEVGRGPLAGPVVAAAVAVKDVAIFGYDSDPSIPDAKLLNLIRDSKKLSAKQREAMFDLIHRYFYVGIGLCDHRTIDRINILEASFLAMKKAVADLARNRSETGGSGSVMKEKIIILVDGNKVIPNFSHEQKAIVGGDKLIKSISAASIIAKVTRDLIMLDMHSKYPQYGFDQHKGYGTKRHMDSLKMYGPCEIHRFTFSPVGSLRKTRNGGKVDTM